jgi:periplasmic copper chaperone A
MRMKLTVLVLTLVLASLATAAVANDYNGALEIQQPWTRATPKGAKTAAGYMAIKNTGSASDRLTGGSLTSAGGVVYRTLQIVNVHADITQIGVDDVVAGQHIGNVTG